MIPQMQVHFWLRKLPFAPLRVLIGPLRLSLIQEYSEFHQRFLICSSQFSSSSGFVSALFDYISSDDDSLSVVVSDGSHVFSGQSVASGFCGSYVVLGSFCFIWCFEVL